MRVSLARLLPVLALLAASARAETSDRPPSVKESDRPKPAAERNGAAGVPSHRLEWRWRRWGALDYAATATMLGGYLVVQYGMHPPTEPRWRGGILFDAAFRRAIIAGSPRARDRWDVASDVLAIVPQGMAFVDALLVPLFSDNWNVDVAWQLAVIAAQSQALTGLVARAGHFGIARERPDAVPCRRDANYSGGCRHGKTASFPGGHVASATAGAAVICVHHQHLPLYGGGFWDAAACAANVGLAVGAGYARMAAGRHYMTDTLAGLAIGAGAGYLLPLWLHYRAGGSSDSSGSLRWTVALLPDADAMGLAIHGWF
jgi:membrane-associated phospholipid phosphatase